MSRTPTWYVMMHRVRADNHWRSVIEAGTRLAPALERRHDQLIASFEVNGARVADEAVACVVEWLLLGRPDIMSVRQLSGIGAPT